MRYFNYNVVATGSRYFNHAAAHSDWTRFNEASLTSGEEYPSNLTAEPMDTCARSSKFGEPRSDSRLQAAFFPTVIFYQGSAGGLCTGRRVFGIKIIRDTGST